MNREDIMIFFRSDESLESLNDSDRFEIIMACASFNDELQEALREKLDQFETLND